MTGRTLLPVSRYGFGMSFAGSERDRSPNPPSPTVSPSSDPSSSPEPGLYLEVIAGNAAGTMIRVDHELVVGRRATGAGQLSQDTEISRQHAHIVREASGSYSIEDLGSSNGTFVNGLKIASPTLLAEGDSIELGATTLVVGSISGAGPAAPDTSPPVSENPPTIFARSAVAADATPASIDETEIREPGPLTLSLEVDFDAREASIALGEGGERVRMIFKEGRWQTSVAGP